MMIAPCGITGIDIKKASFHHYYPKPYRSNVQRSLQDSGIVLCTEAHRWLHERYSNYELAQCYNNYQALSFALLDYRPCLECLER